MLKSNSTALFVLALLLLACGGPAQPETRVTLDTAETRELLGEDDGFDAAIFFGGELMGSTDGCGCFGTPLAGGMAYRFAYAEGFKAAYPDVATLQVDAGFSLVAPNNAEGKLLGDLVTKNAAMILAFDKLGFDAVNLTAHDAEGIATYFATDQPAPSPFVPAEATDDSALHPPILSNMVSANMVSLVPTERSPQPFIVAELVGKRLPASSVRVAIVGLTESIPEALGAGFLVRDPVESLAAVLPEARKAADVVLVLAFLDKNAAATLTEKFAADVDLFVIAHPTVRDLEPTDRVAYARYKSMYLGELRLTFDGKKLASSKTRYIKMYEPLPRDPLADKLAKAAKEAIKKAQLERFEEQ